MIARISYGSNATGAYMYNEAKVQEGVAERLADKNFPAEQHKNIFFKAAAISGMAHNCRVDDHTFHVSLNFHPEDKNLSNHEIEEIAHRYMTELGYQNQPYSIYRHNDTGHQHVHIISSRINEDNKLVNSRCEFAKSKKITTGLEKEYQLCQAPITKQKEGSEYSIGKEGNLETKKGVRSKVAKALREIKETIKFNNYTEFKAALSLYDISAAEVKLDENKTGIVYKLSLNGKEYRPIKASEIYHKCTHDVIEKMAYRNSQQSKPDIKEVQKRFEWFSSSYEMFSENKIHYQDKPFVPLISRYKDGTIYGVRFLDKKTRTLFKASDIVKDYEKENFILKFDKDFKLSRDIFSEKTIRQAYYSLRKEQFNVTPKEYDFALKTEPGELCSLVLREKNITIDEHTQPLINELLLNCENFISEKIKSLQSKEDSLKQRHQDKETLSNICFSNYLLYPGEKQKASLDFSNRYNVTAFFEKDNYLKNIILKNPGYLNSITEPVISLIEKYTAEGKNLSEKIASLSLQKESLFADIKSIAVPVSEKTTTDMPAVYKEWLYRGALNHASLYIILNEIKNNPLYKGVNSVDAAYALALSNHPKTIIDKAIFQKAFTMLNEKQMLIDYYKGQAAAGAIPTAQFFKTNWNRVAASFTSEINRSNPLYAPNHYEQLKAEQTVFADIIKNYIDTGRDVFKKIFPEQKNKFGEKFIDSNFDRIEAAAVSKIIRNEFNSQLLSANGKAKEPFWLKADRLYERLLSEGNIKNTYTEKIRKLFPHFEKVNIENSVTGFINDYMEKLKTSLPLHVFNAGCKQFVENHYREFLIKNNIRPQNEGKALAFFITNMRQNPTIYLASPAFMKIQPIMFRHKQATVDFNELTKRYQERLNIFTQQRINYLSNQNKHQRQSLQRIQNAILNKNGYSNALGVKKNRGGEEHER